MWYSVRVNYHSMYKKFYSIYSFMNHDSPFYLPMQMPRNTSNTKLEAYPNWRYKFFINSDKTNLKNKKKQLNNNLHFIN